MSDDLSEEDYRTLSEFRFELRRFLRFSEQAARTAGLTPQYHQALLAIRASDAGGMLIGDLAERLLLRPHSTSELVDRLQADGLVVRVSDAKDRRQVHVSLTERSISILASLSADHRAELRKLRPLLRRLLDAL